MHRILLIAIIFLIVAAAFGSLSKDAKAGDGLPIFESCMNGTPPLWVLGGVGGSWVAHFTSGVEDPAGQGWLRLTSNVGNQAGYAYYDYAFHSSYGIVVSFEYVSWGGTGADGVGFFLFDGSTQNFNIGDVGGSLGYANGCSVNGLSNAYVGIGLDEYGNFANPADRCKNGGPGLTVDSVTVRGSGNGTLGYAWLTTVSVGSYGGIDITGTSTRPVLTGANYRKVLMTITADKKLTVSVQFGASSPYTTLINEYNLATAPGQVALPETLKLGFFASTGGSTNYHEIRNISAAVPADLAVTKTDGLTSVIPGDPITYTVTFSNNGPNDVQDAVVNDPVPASITGVTWTATASPGSSCGQYSGSGNNINTTVNLLNGGNATFLISGTISQTLTGPIINTATITPPVNISDSNPNNNSATDVDTAPPAVTTLSASAVMSNSATLNGNLTSKGSASSVNVSFQWATDAYYTGNGSTYSNSTAAVPMSTTGSFSANLGSLSGNTKYHFRARAVGNGTAYGDDMTFTTGKTPPSVATNPATNVNTNSATLNGNLTSMGTANPVNVSFEWGETISYGNETTAQGLTSAGNFSAPLTGLSPGTTYHFMAKAIGDGSAVGTDMAFTTLSTPPSVTTTDSSDVTTNRATLYGNLTSLGTASPITVSFQYATDAYYTSHSNTYNSETTPQSMTATEPYSSPTHSLLPGTTYHFRAKALGDGTSYGADMNFTTTTTPPSVITQPATNITFNAATLNGNLTSLGTAASGNVSFQWTTDAYYTSHGNTYDSETSPPQTMTDPGNFTFNLSSLSPGTTYHFRAKAVGHGTSYGNDTTFTTNSTPPSVATNAATNVANNSATLNGNLTSMGTATSVNVSFQWTTDAYYTSHGNTYDNETTAQAMGATGSFSAPLSSLSAATTYHFRAKAIGHGTAYGNDTTFTTTQIMHTLTMATSGSGSTTPAAGSYSYAEGSVVNISATAATGWHFSNWSANVANPSSPSTTVTMDADKTVTATFAQDQYTLTINIGGQGNVTRVPNQATYTYGTSVQLTAVPQGGWSFSSWSGDLLGSTNPDTIVMNGNRTVTANFSNSPAVATDSAQNVTSGSATLRGLLTSKGTALSVSVSFEWATDDYYTTHGSYDNETTPPWPMVSTGAFSFALGGLSPETTYHFRAKAVGDGIAYGVDMTFTTRPLQPPNQPPNVHPIQGALCVTLPTILQSAPFSDPDPGDAHAASQWQIRTNTGSYASPVYDSGTDTLHLTSITLSETELDYSTTYYWRLRHEDNHGAWSSWSEETYFMTADTRTGSDITVIREGTSIKFGEVNEGGCTWVTTSGTNPVGPTPPSITAAGSFTDIATTATHTGPTTIGVPYDPSATRNLQNLRLFHWSGSQWEDVTTSVDTVNNIVYGEVSSLSWFFIGGQWVWIEGEGVPAYPNIYIGIASAFGAGFLAFFLRRRLLHRE